MESDRSLILLHVVIIIVDIIWSYACTWLIYYSSYTNEATTLRGEGHNLMSQ